MTRQDDLSPVQPGLPVTRRDFLADAGVAGTATVVPLLAGSAAAQGTPVPQPGDAGAAVLVDVRLEVNGREHRLRIDTRTTLLDLLRETLALTGSKKGCDHGQCGACTVLVNGRRLNACMALAVLHDGASLTTIEGLAQGDTLHPLQAAFIDHDGFQCGYCTPGQICSAVGMLREARQGAGSYVTENLRRVGRAELNDSEIRERMSGNICRCGAYPGIVAAVKAVALPAGRRRGVA